MTDQTKLEQGDDLVLREFIVETNENLERAVQQLLDLERAPDDLEPVRHLFRAVHTLKSSCGWLGFGQLEQLAHDAESLLAKIRQVECPVTPEIAEALLATVDLTRKQLAAITEGVREPLLDDETRLLGERLRTLAGGIADTTDQRRETPDLVPSEAEAPPVARDVSLPQPPKPDVEPTAAQISVPPELSVRVDTQLLDELMKLVGELVVTRNQLGQLVENTARPELVAGIQRLNIVTGELQDRIMLTRMQPLSHVWSRFPRLIRDAANSCGKKVRLQMEGADTELDRAIVEAIRDPLIHLLRNAVDHGIETPEQRSAAGKSPEGVVHLRANHIEGQVHIEVEDDGRGIDSQAVRRRAVASGMLSVADAQRLSDEGVWGLIFSAGLSTRDEVTELSGRGVGMDVVKTDVERVGGRVEVHSALGAGTRVTLRLPLTLAILPSVLVECAGEIYAVPQSNLLELVGLGNQSEAKIFQVGEGTNVYSLRGELLPVLYLRDMWALSEASTESGDVFMLVLQSGGRRFGLVVDSVLDTQEIVIKPLGRHFANTPEFSGATILGDGRLAWILDAAGIAKRGGIQTEGARASGSVDAPRSEFDGVQDDSRTSQMLLMTTRSGTCLTVPLEKVLRLEEISGGDIERVGAREVLQYRDGLLRLLRVEDFLGERTNVPEAGHRVGDPNPDDVLQVLVHNDGSYEIGLVVDKFLDIVEDRAELQEIRPRPGVLGSVVLDGRIAEVLDLEAAIAQVTSSAAAKAPQP